MTRIPPMLGKALMRGIPPYDACPADEPGHDARSSGTKGQTAGTSAYANPWL